MKDEDYFKEAAKYAQKSLCLRDKCGAIVVSKDKIIGRGFNGPAGDSLQNRKC